MRETRERSEEQARLHQVEQQRRLEEERRQRLDRDRYRRFLEHAKRWQETKLAKEYLEALKAGGSEAMPVLAGRTIRSGSNGPRPALRDVSRPKSTPRSFFDR